MDESLRGRRPRSSDSPPSSPATVTPERGNFLPAGVADNGRWSRPVDPGCPGSPDCPRAQRGRGASLSDSPGGRRWPSRHGSRRKFISEVRGRPPTLPQAGVRGLCSNESSGDGGTAGRWRVSGSVFLVVCLPAEGHCLRDGSASDGEGPSRCRQTPRDPGVPALSGPRWPFCTLKSPSERPVGFLRRTRASVASKHCRETQMWGAGRGLVRGELL